MESQETIMDRTKDRNLRWPEHTSRVENNRWPMKIKYIWMET